MSLADEIQAIAAYGCCTTGAWYAQQDKDDQKAFDAYVESISDGRGRYKDLHDVCAKHGLTISSKSFREHITLHVGRAA